MVATLIKDKYGICLSLSSVSRLLHALGLSAQRRIRRAYQQEPQAVGQWLQKEFPKIRTLARKAKADIYFADEAGVRSDYHSGTTWAKRGQTPIVSAKGARFGLNLILAINPRRQMRFMITKGRVGAKVFMDFPIRMIHNTKRPIFQVVDAHQAHHAKQVSEFAESVKDRLRMFFLCSFKMRV
jgi:hypothetical protein